MSETKKVFIMPEITDQDMEKLNKSAKRVYDRLKLDVQFANTPDEDVLSSAIVLSIFGVFDPDNLPMTEEQIDTIYRAYQDWLRKKYVLN